METTSMEIYFHSDFFSYARNTTLKNIWRQVFFLAFSLYENKPTVCKMSACLSDTSQTCLADTRVNESIEACIPQRRHLDETQAHTVNKKCIFL